MRALVDAAGQDPARAAPTSLVVVALDTGIRSGLALANPWSVGAYPSGYS